MTSTTDNKQPAPAYPGGPDYRFDTEEITLGPWTSDSLRHDPKHLSFVLARYKFCAKILAGRPSVLEVGPGDGVGLPLIAQAVGHVYAVDWDPRLIEGNKRRLAYVPNVTHQCVDLNAQDLDLRVDAAMTVDVIEHLEAHHEDHFMRRIVRCLHPDGVLLTGTPNKTAEAYASEHSRLQHINLKTFKELQALTSRYCKNVFMFGMNDEVLHTGYGPMCHYLWSLGVGIRPEFLDGAQA
jgi:2-polyprenyl-3-methyl-5-hydroxy-6-metoxy-1,4-benzoquinol methylase